MLRPDVVWFGEPLPQAAMQRALRAAYAADVFLVAGTSSVVYPAAALPHIAREHGAKVIEINLEPTELSAVADVTLRGKCGDILPQMLS